MAVPQTLLWDREPHTKAKHDMLGVYLGAWFPIIASRYADTGATYAEGFSGPGEYSDQSEGSPLIALRAANTPEVTKHTATLRMVFVEERADRLDHLVALIDAKHLRRAGRDITPICGTCEADLLPALDQVGAWAGPLFVNLDGWGVDTPYDIVRRVGASKSSEVMITFGPQFFTRFAALEDIPAGDIVFGEAGWRDVADVRDGPAKKQFLVSRYRARLHDAGFIFTLTFEMLDEGGHGVFLVFGTGNRLGLEKMKDAMWSVDKVSGQRFRDPRDVNQLTFEILDHHSDLALLKGQLLDRLGGGPTSLETLKEFALTETVFKPAHVDPAVRALVEARKVNRSSARRHEDVIVQLAPATLF